MPAKDRNKTEPVEPATDELPDENEGAHAKEATGESNGESTDEIQGDSPDEGLPVEQLKEEHERLKADLESVQEELAKERDQHLRLRAEFDNYRRRTRREMDEIRATASEGLALELLPVLDNLERAVQAANVQDNAAKALADGVQMVLKQFLATLEKVGVVPIDAVGQPFDPTLHEAVFEEESDEFPDGHVIEEMQRGYRLNEKVIRPSMVKVAKGTGAKEEADHE